MYTGLLGLPPDSGRVDHIHGSFARRAYKDGITKQDTRGYNAYKFGMAAGSDSHNTGSPYRHDNFFGGHAEIDGTIDRRLAGVLLGNTLDVRLENPGGLTGVWAEENTRASIWDAMYRKETFGVSGPHIKLRFFGGWGYNKVILNAGDWVHQSYANGVPMGADLPEDTIYPSAFNDGDGNPLNSGNKYVMHHDKCQLTPTNATWSVSQYQGNFYVVNSLNRYVVAPWQKLKSTKTARSTSISKLIRRARTRKRTGYLHRLVYLQHHHSQLLAERRRAELHLQKSTDH
jgi:hypothetical protein